jgi:hypothetical protein
MSEMLAGLPNAQLLARVRELVRCGNAVEAELLVHLAEVDARQLYHESALDLCNNTALSRAQSTSRAPGLRRETHGPVPANWI